MNVVRITEANAAISYSEAILVETQLVKRWQAPDGAWWCLVEYKKPGE